MQTTMSTDEWTRDGAQAVGLVVFLVSAIVAGSVYAVLYAALA
jgi:hypothetical protein